MRSIILLSLLFTVAIAAPVPDNEVSPDTKEGVEEPVTPKVEAAVTEMNSGESSSVGEATTMEPTTMSPAADGMPTMKSMSDETPKGKADEDSDVKPMNPENPEKKGDEEMKPAMPGEEMKPAMPGEEKPGEEDKMKPMPEDGKNPDTNTNEDGDNKPNEGDENLYTVYTVFQQPPIYRYNPFYFQNGANYPGVNFGPQYPTYHRGGYPTFGSPSVGYPGGYRVVVVPQIPHFGLPRY